MKHSHYRAPRTLADCSFDSGYPTAKSSADVWDVVIAVIGVVVVIGILGGVL